jgi:hypothetical protein
MAEAHYEKKPVNQIIQALDALSQTLSQARANRRTSPRALSRSSSSNKDGVDDAVTLTPRALFRSVSSKDRTADAGEASPRPRIRRRSSAPTSPFQARPTPDNIENGEEEDGDSARLKSQGFVAAADGEEKKGIRAPSRNGGMRRMGCLCSVEVVATHGLPPSTDGLRLAVTVRKKETRDGAVQTMTARMQLGAADFEQALYVRCHLYGTVGAAGEPTSFEPRPFLLSLVVDAPELDMGRSTVDLSLFAKEFTEKCQQGESFQQWDIAIPLAGKAEGGELVIKLAFQSIVDESAPKMTRPRSTLKVDVPAPDLRGVDVDGFKLDDLEAEPSPIEEVKEMQQKELERTPADEHTTTPVAEVKEEEQLQEREAADNPIPMADMKEEEDKQQKELEPTDDPTLVANVKEEEEKQKEPESNPVGDELIPVGKVKEEQQKEPEREAGGAQKDDDLEAPNFDVTSNGVDRQEVKAELKEEVDTKNEIDEEEEEVSLTAGDEVAKAVSNGLEEKFVELTMPNDMSETVVEAVELVDDEAALPEEVNRESLKVAEKGGDKDTPIKLSRRRLKWRTVALLIPVSVLFSKTLGAN